jgi:hypothetical protein
MMDRAHLLLGTSLCPLDHLDTRIQTVLRRTYVSPLVMRENYSNQVAIALRGDGDERLMEDWGSLGEVLQLWRGAGVLCSASTPAPRANPRPLEGSRRALTRCSVVLVEKVPLSPQFHG